MADPRYNVEPLEDNDPDEVYEWAYGSCRMAPIEALVTMTGSADPSRDEIIEAVASEFPAETRESARAGGRAGFEARDRDAREREADGE